MKILVICQYYYPEPFRITDICEKLVERGHEVDVVTGIPNYPLGEIYDGYKHGEKREEVINGVHVQRCFTIARKHGPIYRFLNYYSFSFSSSRFISKLKKDYDVVLANQLSPVMMANAAIKYKKKTNKKVILYCLDLWPESLVVGGVKRDSLIYRFFYKTSKKIYTHVDKILTTSKSFSDYFEKQFGIKECTYMPQYAEDIFSPELCRKKADDYTDIMFAGNVGTAQSVETIIDAAKLTKIDSKIRWHIVGDGSELDRIKKNASEMANVFFYGRKSLEDMPKFYSMADAMLVTMTDDPVISLTLPGKVQTYLAAGKPIIGAINGEAKCVIEESECGFVGAAMNAEELANNALRLAKSPNKEKMGLMARKYYEDNFQKEKFFDCLEKYLSELSEKK